MRQTLLSAAVTKPLPSLGAEFHQTPVARLQCPATGLLVMTAVLFCGPIASAQAPQADNRAPRPAAQPLRVQQLPPELEQLLINWERATSQIKTLQGKHHRMTFNSVFFTETWAKGNFYYEAPDKGRIDVQPYDIPEDAVSKRKDPMTGEPYKLQPERPERWVCTGKEILQIHDAEKQYDVSPLPPDMQGVNIINGPLPFLFGMPPDVAKRRFELSLVGKNETSYYIKAIPRLKEDAANYQSALIMLDRRKFLPSAVKMYGTDGSTEIIYQFKDLQINQGRNFLTDLIRIGQERNPFEPDLKGYQPVQKAAPAMNPNDPRNAIPRTAGPAQPRTRQ